MNQKILVHTLKIGTLIFVTILVFAILFKSGSALFSGDWATVYQINFKDENILTTMGIRLVVSYGYAYYISAKNQK